MGYYSYFELKIKHDAGMYIDMPEVANMICIGNGDSYRMEKGANDILSIGDAKWYDHKKDIAAMSKFYTDVIFQLDREGGDSGDLERCYFKNGTCQSIKATIYYEEYNEDELCSVSGHAVNIKAIKDKMKNDKEELIKKKKAIETREAALNKLSKAEKESLGL